LLIKAALLGIRVVDEALLLDYHDPKEQGIQEDLNADNGIESSYESALITCLK